eukprot:TRINITY_DN9371_c0_g1_i2.p1 TRINITY_DN9371_c0_g1~~TRINITY_DN9371_c0_g1_i2.p1  ORF type:complete len:589 (-),score=89.19 TRINITY_DN9371_c0_g1_i2:176-1942(-)
MKPPSNPSLSGYATLAFLASSFAFVIFLRLMDGYERYVEIKRYDLHSKDMINPGVRFRNHTLKEINLADIRKRYAPIRDSFVGIEENSHNLSASCGLIIRLKFEPRFFFKKNKAKLPENTIIFHQQSWEEGKAACATPLKPMQTGWRDCQTVVQALKEIKYWFWIEPQDVRLADSLFHTRKDAANRLQLLDLPNISFLSFLPFNHLQRPRPVLIGVFRRWTLQLTRQYSKIPQFKISAMKHKIGSLKSYHSAALADFVLTAFFTKSDVLSRILSRSKLPDEKLFSLIGQIMEMKGFSSAQDIDCTHEVQRNHSHQYLVVLDNFWKMNYQIYNYTSEFPALSQHFQFKQIEFDQSAEPVRWYGCSKSTKRCHKDEYFTKGRWTPPCCRSHLTEMTLYIRNLFEKHGIPYWTDFGTLIGAIRHDGDIIPWDEDIDLSIPEEYAEQVHDLIRNKEMPYHYCDYISYPTQSSFRVCYSEENELHVDIWVYKKVDVGFPSWFSYLYLEGRQTKKPYAPLSSGYIYGDDGNPRLASITLMNTTFPAPYHTISYLHEKYGPRIFTEIVSKECAECAPSKIVPATNPKEPACFKRE